MNGHQKSSFYVERLEAFRKSDADCDALVGEIIKRYEELKIKYEEKLFLPSAQCKHVFFGPCHDNGYLPVLESYRNAYASRSTFIETTPVEPGFKGLGFKGIRSPQVFRPQGLPKQIGGVTSPLAVRTNSTPMAGNSSAFATAAPFAPSKATSPSPAPSAGSSANDTSSWAAVGKSGAGASKTISIASKKAAPRKYVLTNVNDERLDERLPDPDTKAHQRFTEKTRDGRNFCNNYHLQGHWPTGDEYCDYIHGERLTGGGLLVLKHKARS